MPNSSPRSQHRLGRVERGLALARRRRGRWGSSPSRGNRYLVFHESMYSALPTKLMLRGTVQHQERAVEEADVVRGTGSPGRRSGRRSKPSQSIVHSRVDHRARPTRRNPLLCLAGPVGVHAAMIRRIARRVVPAHRTADEQRVSRAVRGRRPAARPRRRRRDRRAAAASIAASAPGVSRSSSSAARTSSSSASRRPVAGVATTRASRSALRGISASSHSHSRAVVVLDDRQPDRPRVPLRAQLVDEHQVAEALRHLVAVHEDHRRVHPVPDERLARRRLALGPLALVVREDQVACRRRGGRWSCRARAAPAR